MINIASARQPTKAGLAMSIQDLEQALTALNDRRMRAESRTHMELITCDILLDTIKRMREGLPFTSSIAARQTSGA